MLDRTQRQSRGINDVVVELTSQALVQSFNTWAFKRQQPSSLELLLSCARAAVSRQTPLEFILYWGKGQRSGLAEPDTECLSYLFSMTKRIEAVYAPGAQLTLLFTDTHARLNRHSVSSTEQYFHEVGAAARDFGFSFRRLSDVVAFAPRSLDEPKSICPPEETLAQLARCAAKWYLGDEIPEEAASTYFAMNMREKRAVERTFPRSIFTTFNGGQFRILFPDNMPIFYMYSLRKGCAVKPWFSTTNESNDKDILALRSSPVNVHAKIF
jgi:L-tyrosine isonitrile synthase